MAKIREFYYHAYRNLLEFDIAGEGFNVAVIAEPDIRLGDTVIVEGVGEEGVKLPDLRGTAIEIEHILPEHHYENEDPWYTAIRVECNQTEDIKRHIDLYKGFVHG